MKSAPVSRLPRRPVDTLDYLAMLDRVLRGAGPRVADEAPEQLRRLLELREVLDQAIVQAVSGLRRSGFTWAEIGTATGTTSQAAVMKWAHKVADRSHGT